MAGLEDEDEFKDALSAADPPPCSPKPTPTKSKPSTPGGGGGGGLGRRLFASIPLPATLSADIGRLSSPKPPASNVGLGLLLDAGPAPSADGIPASDADSGGSSLHLPSLAALQQQHGDDQVAGSGASVGEEELGLVPAEEGWGTDDDSRKKEGLAVYGRCASRNCFRPRGQEEEEGEQCPGDELAASVAKDHGVVVEQQGASEVCAALVEDESNYAVEQCAGDETRAVKASKAVEVNETVINQGCAGGILDAAEDGVPVGLQEEENAMVEEQDMNVIYVQDQHEVVECAGDQLTTTTEEEGELCPGDEFGAAVAQDQEVVVEQQGATEDCAAVVEDESNYFAVEQCVGDGAVKASSAVEVNEMVINQECAGGILDVAEDGVSVGLQEENAMVEEQGMDVISVHDQHEVVEQCAGDQLTTTTEEGEQCPVDELGAAVAQDQEVVVEQQGATEDCAAVVEDESNYAVEQCGAVKASNAVEVNEMINQECVGGILDAAEDGGSIGLQEDENAMVEEQGMNVISLKDQHEATLDDHAAENQKVVEQVDIVERVGNESRSTNDENVLEDKDVINIQGVINDDSCVEAQEEGGVVADQGGDDMSSGDEGNVVEQCTNNQLRATMKDNTAESQELVDQEGAYFEKGMTAGGIVKDQAKEAKQSAGNESSVTEGENAVEDNKKVDQEDSINRQGSVKEDSGVEPQQEGSAVDADQGVDDPSVLDEGNVVAQCTSGQLRTTMEDSAAEWQEVVEQGGASSEKSMASDGITVEDQDKEMAQSAGDESKATKGDNAVEHKVYQEDDIDKQGAAKDGSGIESQEENMVVPDQGSDGPSILDEGNVVLQCTSDHLRTTTENNSAVDLEVVEEEGIGSILGSAKVGIAVEESREEDIMVAEQVEDGIFVQDQDVALEQRTSDQQRTITDDNAVEDQEVHREKIALSEGYPQRPGKLNCRFYMSTGSCSYGSSCHFNHPRLRAKLEASNFHSEQRNHEVEFLELNRIGLPIREGARKCTYYMRNGTCRYGKKCCYNHPEQVLDVQLHMATGWDDTNLQSSPHSKKSPEHGTVDDISSGSEILPLNILRMLLPPQNVPPCTEEKEMRIKKDPDWASASDDSDGCCSADSSDGPLCKQEHGDYPDKPECPFLLKFGNCRFASSCRYYHPKDKSPSTYHPEDKFESRYHLKEKSSRYHPKKEPALSGQLMVYPGRPGEPECPFYVKTGSCKFGAKCKFHHPKDITPSLQGPASPKRSVAANDHHPAARTTLQDQTYQQQKYPERPGQPDCRYYMQFGTCKFQSACIFNHPKDILSSGWHPAECPFYMKTGTCQFGSACEFYHPKNRCSSRENVLQQQEQGIYPERPGELECPHYMKHGYCKFQMNCKFHHPRDRLPKK